jgi:hypothetical protein
MGLWKYIMQERDEICVKDAKIRNNRYTAAVNVMLLTIDIWELT